MDREIDLALTPPGESDRAGGARLAGALNLDPDTARRLHARLDPKVYIETFGCQMNEHDTEIMYGILGRMGYAQASGPEEADVLLFNTCAIRESAVEHALGRIGQLKPLKYKNPDLVVGVCGCLPQVEGQTERLLRMFPHLDLIFGTHNIHQLPELIERARHERETVVDVWESMGPDGIPERLPVQRAGTLKAWVTIIYGCNKRCSYCIVPRTRGRERSRLPEDIVAEVQELGRQGYKEITLLGQNVNAYGKDLGYTDFGDLLTLLDQSSPGIERIRFTTNHPKDFTPKMVEAIARAPKVCEWLHLPVQSGSDAVLRRMRRSYNRRQYLDLVRRIREWMPDAVITTDIIVGFPGETEDDFRQTLSLVEEVGYDAAFMFMFSPRAGTEAATLPDQLPQEVKKERLQRLIELQNRVSLAKNQAMVGRVEEILVEGLDKGKADRVYGRTRGNKLVTAPGSADLIGRLVPVRITEAHIWTLEGSVVEAAVATG
ncbi:tRNA (N6-isopentenyl adenosine(37)-C2)-methylthiotransferase MiaB [Caldinitratiruptor microaerophilus]|uniref:tRNA-2-methylthio-N(6)-dimethylallyladenosine synthase n=1 Tax=Caldinitratiruptor microaerophilus TaxID=671077 RepID=A0AA35CMD0_9FIRM|nr:tRNA (N6-isopentenyl adenosine(37)-C2)-methylthiotransferase MiaB [Caldinitratiruptor microaerophilus]BDG59996.1 tRNA-2-methylthio-N(6)-dimethylallyladenosine synthase [Caldinitratiruptor microaerophilus]